MASDGSGGPGDLRETNKPEPSPKMSYGNFDDAPQRESSSGDGPIQDLGLYARNVVGGIVILGILFAGYKLYNYLSEKDMLPAILVAKKKPIQNNAPPMTQAELSRLHFASEQKSVELEKERRKKQQEEYRELIKSLGGSMESPVDPYSSYLTLDFTNSTKITDADLKRVAGPLVTRLTLKNTNIPDEGLKHLEHQTHLRYLNIEGTKTTSDGIKFLRDKGVGYNLEIKR